MPVKKLKYNVRSEVWLYPGMAGWHFVSLSKAQSEEIKKNYAAQKRGWGSLPVEVKLGKSTWRTSIFPDKRSGTYLLPLKSEIRKKEEIFAKEIVFFYYHT